MTEHLLQRPAYVIHVIAGEAELGAILHQPSKLVKRIPRNQSAAFMSPLRPRVGEQKEQPSDARVGQGIENKTCVVVKNPDVGEAVVFHQRQRRGNSINERLTADKADTRMGPGLGGEVLAATEPDFEPHVLRRVRETVGEGADPAARRYL